MSRHRVFVDVFLHLDLLFLIDISGSMGRLFFIVWQALEQSSKMASFLESAKEI